MIHQINKMGVERKVVLLLITMLLLFLVSGFVNYSGTFSSASSSTIRVVATVPAGLNPQFLAYNPSNKLVYVANLDDGGTYTKDTVSIINGTKNIGTVTVGESPNGIIYNPSNHEVYVADSAFYAQSSGGYKNAGVSVIKAEKLVKTVLQGTPVCFLVYNPSNKLVYASDELAVYAINSQNSIAGKITLQGKLVGCIQPVYDPSNHEVYVAYFDTNSIGYIVAISGTKVVADIKVGYLLSNWGQTLAYDPVNGYIYASGSSGVYIINGNTNKYVGEIAVTAPVGIAYDPANKDVYVAGRYNVSVISSSTNKIVATIKSGFFPAYFAYDPTNRDMYVTTTSGINVISPSNSLVTTIADSNQPAGIIYDPSNTYVYVSNIADGVDTVTILSS